MKVFVHIKGPEDKLWHNEGRDFVQVPHVGEYFAMAVDSPLYEVKVVIHCPFEAQFDAEVSAIEAGRSHGKLWRRAAVD